MSGLLFPLLVLTYEPLTGVIQQISYIKTPPDLSPLIIENITKDTLQISLHGKVVDSLYLTSLEKQHLLDVNAIIQIMQKAAIISISLTLGIIILLRRYLYSYLPVFIRVVKLIIITICLSIIGALFFNKLFISLHLILFPQGNWTFPATSLLIQTFPLPFWLLCFSTWITLLLIPIAFYSFMKTSLER